MKYAILIVLASISAAQSAEFRQYYISNGKRIDAAEALIRSMRGEEIDKCQSVQAAPNKKGTSVSLKNVKKPKAD